jgi:hypothetical protein
MQDSIIVYRNPLEKQMWEGNGMAYMGLFFVVAIVSFMLVYKGLCIVTGKDWRQPEWFLWVSGIVSVSLGVLACVCLIH